MSHVTPNFSFRFCSHRLNDFALLCMDTQEVFRIINQVPNHLSPTFSRAQTYTLVFPHREKYNWH